MMNAGFHNLGRCIGLILRRDRFRIAAVLIVALALVVSGGYLMTSVYDAAERQVYFDTASGNPVQLAIRGRIYGAEPGMLLAWSVQTAGSLLLAIAALLLMLRHTRTEEVAGHAELLGGQPVGRIAMLAAAFAVQIGIGLGLAVAVAAILGAVGFPVAGAFLLGLMLGAIGIFFAAIGALLAQLTVSARAASTIGFSLIGAFLALRSLANHFGVETLAWLTPFGWAERIAPFAHDQVAWLLPFAVAASAVFLAAFRIRSGRDLGAGLFPPREGNAEAPASLNGVFALAWLQHRTTMLGWPLAFIAVGLVIVPGLEDVDAQLGAEGRALILAQGGVVDPENVADLFLNYLMILASAVLSALAILQMSKLRRDETSGPGELLLSTGIGRTRFALGHLVFAAATPIAALAALGTAAGLGYGMAMDDIAGYLPRVLLSALVTVPVAWVMGGLTFFVIGIAPRLLPAVWAFWTLVILIDLLRHAHPVIESLLVIAPVMHVPWILAGSTAFLPLFGLVAISGTLVIVGLVAFGRRDITV